MKKNQKMSEVIQRFLDKKFEIVASGEKRTTTNFLEVIRILTEYGDFEHLTDFKQKKFLEESLGKGYIYVDSDIVIKIKKRK